MPKKYANACSSCSLSDIYPEGIYEAYNFVTREKCKRAFISPSLEIITMALTENENFFFIFRSLVVIIKTCSLTNIYHNA